MRTPIRRGFSGCSIHPNSSRRRFGWKTPAVTTAMICMCLPSAVAAGDFSVTLQQARGALDEYVKRNDPAYAWSVRRQGRVGSTRYAELILTSQVWRGIPWRHQLFLLRPSRVPEANRQGLLVIAGGSWKDALAQPPADDEKLPSDARRMALLAEVLQTPIAVLLQVPRQPMFGGKHEDEIISYTFDQFLQSSDTDWPLLLPMVKSAVRAMDASQEFCHKEWQLQVDAFTVTGASKRGWTTWLTGAVDRRATAIAPMVIDVLNMKSHLDLQKRAWGKYSEQIADYTERGLPDLMNSPPGDVLREIVDPYSYRKRLVQPKLLLIGTNDRYWPVDALNLYWKDLPGPKYITYVPNQGHGLNDLARVAGSINALHQHAARGFALPKLRWSIKRTDDGVTLSMSTDKPARTIRAWIATSPQRDFRNAKWSARDMKVVEGAYEYILPQPEQGYAAIFGEATYSDLPMPYFFSTTLQLIGSGDSVTTTAADSE